MSCAYGWGAWYFLEKVFNEFLSIYAHTLGLTKSALFFSHPM